MLALIIIISFNLISRILLASIATDQYLTHYWSISNRTMLDSVGNADMQQGSATTFTSDRFGCPNSSLNLNGGYTFVPAGVYFNAPQFTISVWIYPLSVGAWARIIDFGNGAPLDNIVLSQDSGSNLLSAFHIYSGSSYKGNIVSSTSLTLSQWQFLTATFNGSTSTFYINGVSKGSVPAVYILPTITRTNNYIGKSNWNDGYSSSYLDDLRFYNKSLTQTEIIQLMSLNSMAFF